MLQRQTIGEKQASWQRAIARAVEKDYERALTYLGTAHFPDGKTESLFVIDSASTSGQKYMVRLLGIPGEGMRCSCDCPAGQRGDHWCWHIAAAALVFGMVMPTDAETAGAA